MPYSVQNNVLSQDIIAHAVRPNLESPLADALSLELLDLRCRAKGISLQALERLQNLLLGCGRESLQITLEAARQMDGKANWHAVLASLTGA